MKYEDMDLILNRGLSLGFISELSINGLRDFEFKVPLSGKKYTIAWWVNICYLTTECGAYIPFHGIEFSGTWPNNFKTNIQLSYLKETCCIIPVEKYR